MVFSLRILHFGKSYDIVSAVLLLKYRALHNGRRFSYISAKEVRHMPITLTIHILGYTITIRVKKQNRHPAR